MFLTAAIDTPATVPVVAIVAAPGVPVAADAPPVDGEVVVEARRRQGDPLEAANVESFKLTEAVDKAVIAPIARTYERVPHPARKALRHLKHNLHEPANFLNFMLQHKIGRAAKTVVRFAINSTVGLAGLIDVAAKHPIGIPYYRNGFANTMGFYGVGAGPYLFLPIIGPSSARDFVGQTIDHFMSPLRLLKPFKGRPSLLPVTVLNALDRRSDFDDRLEQQRASQDPYTSRRQYYLESRQAEIDALRHRKRIGSQAPVPPRD